MSNTRSILRIDASMRHQGSITRELTSKVIKTLSARNPGSNVVTRDLAEGVPLVSANWIEANFTDPKDRTNEQRHVLSVSDMFVAELKAADTIVIGMPVYNFSVPAALKAWIDMIARARETFSYTEAGPVGLLEGKQAIIVAASGGTAIDSEIDFATPYLRHALGFVGIHDVVLVGADRLMVDADTALEKATREIASLAA